MNKELKDKWVKALRSGDYDQGKGALCQVSHTGAEYCCLGVLYEVEHGPDKWEDNGDGFLHTHFGSRVVYSQDPSMPACCLVTLNDSNGWTFEKIADWIEENL